MSLGWAIVGMGSHARRRVVPALAGVPDVRLAAVVSRDMDRAQALANEFGFSRAYDSYSELLRDDAVDVVYISTPNSLHATQAIEAARAGKHVLVEKPMALTTADAEKMVEECEARDVRLGVGFHLRHHSAHKDARMIIDSGRLGKAFLYETRWIEAASQMEGWRRDSAMSGAYVLMARGVHLIDFVCYLSGQEPRSVTVMTDGQRPEKPLDEVIIATFCMDDDVFATVLSSRLATGSRNSFAVRGTEGSLEGVGTVGLNPTGILRLQTANSSMETDYHGKDPIGVQIEAFNLAVKNGTMPSASGLDGLRVVRITEAMLESARTGRTVAVAGST